MKDKKRCAISFRYRDCDAFAQYLRRQSGLGWHFKEFKLGMVFERGEPGDIVYAVEVFPKGSETDTRPEEDAKEYAAYCEAAGWQLLDGQKRFCVFRRTREDAVPIVEPEERFRNIRRAEWREWLGTALSPILLSAMWWWAFFTISFRQYVFHDTILFFLLAVTAMAAAKLWDAGALLFWSARVKRQLAAGEAICYGKGRRKGNPWFLFAAVMTAGILIAYKDGNTQMVIPVLIAAVGLMLCGIVIAVRRPSRADSEGIRYMAAFGTYIVAMLAAAVILTSDPDREPQAAKGPDVSGFPLIQADYSDRAGEITYTDSGAADGVLGSIRYFYVTVRVQDGADTGSAGIGVTESLSYTIYQSSHAWILDRLWGQEIKRFDGAKDCAGEWQALRAVCVREDGITRYLVRCGDRLIVFWTETAPDSRGLAVIREKLTAYGL